MNRTRCNYVDASTENLCAFPSCSSPLAFYIGSLVGLLADRDERHTRDRSTGLVNSTTSQLTDIVIDIVREGSRESCYAMDYATEEET